MRNTIIIEQKAHKYLAQWISDDGLRFSDWFQSLKEIREYFGHWEDVEYIYI